MSQTNPAAPIRFRVRRTFAFVVSPFHPLDGQRVEVTGRGRGSDVHVRALDVFGDPVGDERTLSTTEIVECARSTEAVA